MRLLKNKSDDIERYDHVQFLIREISANNKSDNVATSTKEEAGKEPPDDTVYLCEGKCTQMLLTLYTTSITLSVEYLICTYTKLPNA